MTQVADPHPPSDRPSPDRHHDICPFLLADSAWRSATPAKEHRCLALGEDVPLALDKQKRLCLTAGHRACPAYVGALGLGALGLDEPAAGDASASHAVPRRPYPRMAPVVFDHGRMAVGLPAAARDRPAGQIALAALMVVAFGAIALSRLAGITDGGLAASAVSPSPQASIVAALPSPTPAPTPSPELSPSAAPAAPEPSPKPELRTYRVKRGDTLIRIAARFGTTVKALMTLNEIDNPARIAVGTRLKLPAEASAP
jgi:LysM repeat protein